jgi:hypothetical protein
LIRVEEVLRENKVPKKVVISAGDIKISYILGKNGKIVEVGRSCDKQVLDDQSLYVSPADYRQIIKTVFAIFGENKRKAPAS